MRKKWHDSGAVYPCIRLLKAGGSGLGRRVECFQPTLKTNPDAVWYFPPCVVVKSQAGFPFFNRSWGLSKRPYRFRCEGAGGCSM